MKNEKNQPPKILRPRPKRKSPAKLPPAPKANIRTRVRPPAPEILLTIYPPSSLFFLFDVKNIMNDDPLFKDISISELDGYFQNEPIDWLLNLEKECEDLILDRLENFWNHSIFSGTAFLHKANPQTLNILGKNQLDKGFWELSDVGLMPPNSELYISLDASLILNVLCRCRADCLYGSASLLFNKSSLSAQYISYSKLLIELANKLPHKRIGL